jgi:hypothetical protein
MRARYFLCFSVMLYPLYLFLLSLRQEKKIPSNSDLGITYTAPAPTLALAPAPAPALSTLI